jgi:hypothetical protein
MKVLAIGNSFSQDATRYLHQIAEADDFGLTVVNLYIGGCSLEKHWQNAEGDLADYEYELNGEKNGEMVSIRQALESDSWDIVTLQQSSWQSTQYNTYQPYLNALSQYVKKYAPNAEQVIHQTWAYEQGSERLTSAGYQEQKDMFLDIKKAYHIAAAELGDARIIPSGESFQIAQMNHISKLHRDTFHASYGLGRYLLGLVWYETLTGNSIEANSFKDLDEPVEDALIKVIKRCAHEAVEKYHTRSLI